MDELEEIKRKKLRELMKKLKEEEENIIEVDDKNFEKKVIEKSKEIPVIVDFFATWCFPCKILSPILEKIAEEYKGKIILAKVNVDEAREHAIKYNIQAVPTVKFFKDGKVLDEFVGVMPEERIKEWLNKNLSLL